MSRSGSELCTQCGICCDGSWLDDASLQADEIQSAEAIGLKVKGQNGRYTFALPCPRLRSCRCTVYDRRPRVCGGFECHLLRGFIQGEKTLDESLMIVAKAKTIIRALQETGQSLPQMRKKLRSFLTENRVDLIHANSRWVFQYLALITLLRRKFGEIGPKETNGPDLFAQRTLQASEFADTSMHS